MLLVTAISPILFHVTPGGPGVTGIVCDESPVRYHHYQLLPSSLGPSVVSDNKHKHYNLLGRDPCEMVVLFGGSGLSHVVGEKEFMYQDVAGTFSSASFDNFRFSLGDLEFALSHVWTGKGIDCEVT
jgi:hypothetical protein